MQRNIDRFTKEEYELLVIGGGINGCAVASLAAACGARTALIEQGDFASGTSSRSTKLLHGGIRYLENLEFDLVAESLKERYIQWKAAPHLVRPMSFLIPVYKGDARPLWMMRAGVALYDLLSGKYSLGPHRALGAAETAALIPPINREGLLGAVEYYDAQMDDARLCLENALMADLRAAHVANYAQAMDLIKRNGRVVGVSAKDVLSGRTFEIFAKTVVSTTGPWSDEIRQKDIPHAIRRLRLTKGAHIVYQGNICSKAVLVQALDKRIFFVIPFKGQTLIGTTDTDHEGSPDAVEVKDKDIEYLLRESSRVFPSITFDSSRIIATFAGLRPLVHDKGSPSKVSRKHVIEQSYSGLWFVLGGKYTTYRAIAEDALAKAMPQLKPRMPYSGHWTVYGSGGRNEELKQLSQRYQMPVETVKYLESAYGSRVEDVLALTQKEGSLKQAICSCSPAIGAQIVYAKRVEMAVRPQDVFERRLQLQYNPCASKRCAAAVEEIFTRY